MIIRIVKMVFRKEHIDDFLCLFEARKSYIRNFKGCRHLELLRPTDTGNAWFTYSIWENEAALEVYRKSGLFKEIWAETRVLFQEKAAAWSLESTGKVV